MSAVHPITITQKVRQGIAERSAPKWRRRDLPVWQASVGAAGLFDFMGAAGRSAALATLNATDASVTSNLAIVAAGGGSISAFGQQSDAPGAGYFWVFCAVETASARAGGARETQRVSLGSAYSLEITGSLIIGRERRHCDAAEQRNGPCRGRHEDL